MEFKMSSTKTNLRIRHIYVVSAVNYKHIMYQNVKINIKRPYTMKTF